MLIYWAFLSLLVIMVTGLIKRVNLLNWDTKVIKTLSWSNPFPLYPKLKAKEELQYFAWRCNLWLHISQNHICDFPSYKYSDTFYKRALSTSGSTIRISDNPARKKIKEQPSHVTHQSYIIGYPSITQTSVTTISHTMQWDIKWRVIDRCITYTYWREHFKLAWHGLSMDTENWAFSFPWKKVWNFSKISPFWQSV